MSSGPTEQQRDLTFHIGHDELVIRQRYEALSIANDILVGLWFIIGSILFFFPSTSTTAIWLFLIGSIEMIIRPIIRMARKVHLIKIRGGSNGGESSFDF